MYFHCYSYLHFFWTLLGSEELQEEYQHEPPGPYRHGGHIDADGDQLFHVCGSDGAIDLWVFFVLFYVISPLG